MNNKLKNKRKQKKLNAHSFRFNGTVKKYNINITYLFAVTFKPPAFTTN